MRARTLYLIFCVALLTFLSTCSFGIGDCASFDPRRNSEDETSLQSSDPAAKERWEYLISLARGAHADIFNRRYSHAEELLKKIIAISSQQTNVGEFVLRAGANYQLGQISHLVRGLLDEAEHYYLEGLNCTHLMSSNDTYFGPIHKSGLTAELYRS